MLKNNINHRIGLSKKKMDTLKIYTGTRYKRKVEVEGSIVGQGDFESMDEEMVRRGLYKKIFYQFEDYLSPLTYDLQEGRMTFVKYEGSLTSISRKTDANIKMRPIKEYAVKNLSLLALIESVLVETAESEIRVDTIKLEILLLLIDGHELFQDKKELLRTYREDTPSIYEYWEFFPTLQGYLFDIAKLIVEECEHDFLINKAFHGELTLTPTDDYDKKYEYFKKNEYYFVKPPTIKKK
jgi:hypothetical protein